MKKRFLDTSPSTTKKKLLHRFVDIRVLAALVSIIFSAWAVFLDDVVNNDGILYLEIAQLFDHGEWQAAFQLYRWPFYSFLISLIAKVPGLSYEYAAHLLNAILAALTVVCFISLVRELGGAKATVLAATIVILLYPGINEYRSFISRDAGYIAFYLLSLLFFFKSLSSPGWGHVVGWACSIVIATLFRIEGVVFVAMLPLLFYFEKHPGRRLGIGGISVLLGIAFALVVILAWWLLADITLSSPSTMGSQISARLQPLWERTADTVSDGQIAFFVSPLVVLLIEIFSRLTVVHAALVGHALYRRFVFPMARAKMLWIRLALLNLMILVAFAWVTRTVTGRFPLALSLTLMLAVPFSLVVLHEAWRDQRTKRLAKKWLFPAVCVLILLFGLDGLYSPTNKTYLKEAGIWLRDNTPPQSTLFTNNKILMFYAARNVYSNTGRFLPSQTLDLIKNEEWQDYDYLAVRIKRKQNKQKSALVETVGRDPVMRFANRKGDEVLIFKAH